ncbi:MAG: nicotinate-nucleotide adenylyltransferase, partial [Pseudomonadota bacterium]
MAGLRIGILGGSFNPAHEGHAHISRQAAMALGLDMVWWLVSPANPQKDPRDYLPLAKRMSKARRMARGSPVAVTDLETDLTTQFTAETLRLLKARMPRADFIWLMGADNLISIHTWQKWSRIFHLCPIAVVGRPTYSL